MRSLIMVAGTPGVGKTAVCRILARRLHWSHVDCGRLALREGLAIKYDRTARTYHIDLERLSRVLKDTVNRLGTGIILEGHLVPSLKELAPSRVFVLRCDPRRLLSRLRQKGYSRSKIAENIAAEILDVCLSEAVKSFGVRRVCEIDASEKDPSEVASAILRILRGSSRYAPPHVDWINRLDSEGGLPEILSYIEEGYRTGRS
ncbi:adenylate kinase family protein [Candidatus Bathyarchaeota archaeon]|nr:adenylate kinase family protein [Candidatus Bathyarchaeota archaeon]